ncbi:hypothetical protein GCM10009131_30780 [Morganella psychrotolerans]
MSFFKNRTQIKMTTIISQTTNKTPRVAVKTSGYSEGKIFSASSLKARIAQRKAEGRS